mgnify:FL=1
MCVGLGETTIVKSGFRFFLFYSDERAEEGVS